MSKKKRLNLEVSGKTTEGKYIYKNCFYFVGTKGLPVEFVFDFIRNDLKGEIDIVDFIENAIKDGWNARTILSRLEPLYPYEYKDKLEKTIAVLYNK